MIGSLGLSGALTLFGILIIYCLPSIVAGLRRHHNRVAIGACNLLLGWTILGWIGALVWALTRPPRSTE